MKKKILITGARGFIGRNLSAELAREPESYELFCADIDTPPELLRGYLEGCDFVAHLAGINRPDDEREFWSGNAGFTEGVLAALSSRADPPPLAMTSSIQSRLDNAYGRSKLEAERAVLEYGRASGAPVYLFRLPNVFGKWCRPNYNSAVATFCHNIARGLPIEVSDRDRELTLIYIDDVLSLIKSAVAGDITPGEDGYCGVTVTHRATLGHIVDTLYGFKEARDGLFLPELREPLDRALYSTYLSFLESDGFACELKAHSDSRGLFAEMFRTAGQGQFSVSTTAPGVTRGNHWHHSKTEKFAVVAGEASIRLRRVDEGKVIEYRVSGGLPSVVDIPPGYTHLIENVSGSETLVTVIWASELFDPERPDTWYLEV